LVEKTSRQTVEVKVFVPFCFYRMLNINANQKAKEAFITNQAFIAKTKWKARV
jgi:hypothetical protein